MKKIRKQRTIPTLIFHSDYFECPICTWQYPGPLRVKGDYAQIRCQNCGHFGLVRIK